MNDLIFFDIKEKIYVYIESNMKIFYIFYANINLLIN